MTVGESKNLKVGDIVYMDDVKGVVQTTSEEKVVLYFNYGIFVDVPHADMTNVTRGIQ